MTGTTIGIIITIAAVLALGAGIVWLFVVGTRPIFPEGVRTEAVYRAHRAIVVWGSPRIERAEFALQAAKAAWATARAWHDIKGVTVFDDLETIGVWVLSDERFDEEARRALPHRDPASVAAWLSKAPQRLGNGPPMPVIRASHLEHAAATGQPVIHELLHSLGGLYYDPGHTNDQVWEDRDDPEVEIEEKAEDLFAIIADHPLEASV